MFAALIAAISCYSEDPEEYQNEGIRHINYEQDQTPTRIVGSNKVKRNLRSDRKVEENVENFHANNQTPAEDRNWQVKPKTKRISKSGKKIHIYIKNDDQKIRAKKQAASSTTTESSATTAEKAENETQTKRTPELTTKSDNIRHIKYTEKDRITASSHKRQSVAAKEDDSKSDATEHHEHVVKEKIKIKVILLKHFCRLFNWFTTKVKFHPWSSRHQFFFTFS